MCWTEGRPPCLIYQTRLLSHFLLPDFWIWFCHYDPKKYLHIFKLTIEFFCYRTYNQLKCNFYRHHYQALLSFPLNLFKFFDSQESLIARIIPVREYAFFSRLWRPFQIWIASFYKFLVSYMVFNNFMNALFMIFRTLQWILGREKHLLLVKNWLCYQVCC